LAAGPPPIESLDDLRRATLIEFEMTPWPASWLDWEAWLRAVGGGDIGHHRQIRHNDYTVALQAAIAGQGVVLGCRTIVRDALEAKLLVMPCPESVKIREGYDVVATAEALKRPEVAAFVDWIRAAAAPAGRDRADDGEPPRA
jgi:LysR family glycine cleavage system transcriptional activator